MTALAIAVFVPAGAAVAAVLIFVGFRVRDAVTDWRDRRGEPYVPTRPVTDRYGSADADSRRTATSDTAIKLPTDQVGNSGIG